MPIRGDAALSCPTRTTSSGSTATDVMVTMADKAEQATPPQLRELVRLLVERVAAAGRTVDPESIVWTAPARPFFQEGAWVWRPRTDSGTQYPRSVLDYYLEVG